MSEPSFRSFQPVDVAACTALFDANCPRFFAESERPAYAEFLRGRPAGYHVCVIDGKVVGAFGIRATGEKKARVNWVIVDPQLHGSGIGSKMIKHAKEIAVNDLKCAMIEVCATHKSAPFFARFGAHSVATRRTAVNDGTLEVDMEMPL